MRIRFLSLLVLAFSIYGFPAFTQTGGQADADTTLLGLPGDNLDLFAVLDLFQKSPSIEDFEKSLNLQETGVNNLDLDLDGNVDFIKVATEQDGDDFAFILQVDVSEKEIQDVAVILVSKDEDEKVTLQMVGDKDLYGNDYVIEPAPPAPKVTANPAYTGSNPVESNQATTTVVVESTPIVQYVYSPVYVPYYPPYTYVYHPPYYAAFTVVAVGVYHNNHYYHHPGYHGGYHGNTVVVHNHNTYNNYNNSRNRSNTVSQHNSNGSYNNSRGSASTRPTTTPSASQSRAGSSAASKPATSSASRSMSSTASRPTTSSASRSMSSSASRPTTSSASRSMGSSASMRGGGGRRR